MQLLPMERMASPWWSKTEPRAVIISPLSSEASGEKDEEGRLRSILCTFFTKLLASMFHERVVHSGSAIWECVFSMCESVIVVVQSPNCVQLFMTPWTAACQASLSLIISWNLPKFISIQSVMPSNHLILCHPLLLLPSTFPRIRVFFSESALCIRWPKYSSFSFSISPSNEYSGSISFRIDWFDLLAVQGALKSLLQHHSSKASILWVLCLLLGPALTSTRAWNTHEILRHPSLPTLDKAWAPEALLSGILFLLPSLHLPVLLLHFLPSFSHCYWPSRPSSELKGLLLLRWHWGLLDPTGRWQDSQMKALFSKQHFRINSQSMRKIQKRKDAVCSAK